MKFCSPEERANPTKVIEVLQELYGGTKSYVALQEAFFLQATACGGDFVGVFAGINGPHGEAVSTQ